MTSGCTPKVFEKRRRTFFPQRSGRTISRKVWSLAPTAGDPNANERSGCATALPDGYGPCADAPHDAVHLWPSPFPSSANTPALASAIAARAAPASRRNLRRANVASFMACLPLCVGPRRRREPGRGGWRRLYVLARSEIKDARVSERERDQL